MKKSELKYKIVENYILKGIESGKFKVGDQIPTEYELCEMFGVGRMTVNKAITSLANRNLIKRISGKGSFVIKKVSRSVTTVGSFTSDMAEVGMKASSKLIEYKICLSSEFPEEAHHLMLKPEEYIIYFKRIRYGDDTPIAVANTFLSAKFFKDFNPVALDGSLDEYMKANGIEADGFVISIEALLASNEYKQYLDLPLNEEAPLLRSITQRFCKELPFEYTRTCYVSNHFEYVFSGGNLPGHMNKMFNAK